MAAVVCQSDVILESDLNALKHLDVCHNSAMQTNSSAVLPLVHIEPEIDQLTRALKQTHWNMTKAAEVLRWSRMTVYRKIAKYGVERPPDDSPGEARDNSEEAFRPALVS
jgi:transcriptional regulator of acetoin/glycerol metabolism